MKKQLVTLLTTISPYLAAHAQPTNLIIKSPASSTPGTFNTIVGLPTAGLTAFEGNENVFLGYAAGLFPGLGFTNHGNGNTYIGYAAGAKTSKGSYNTFLGWRAGETNATGDSNVFIGNSSGANNTGGSNNTYVGSTVGSANTLGDNNTFLGADAGQHNKTGSLNTLLGSQAGLENLTGNKNTFVGTSTGYSNTTGNDNVSLGYRAGALNQTGFSNVVIGESAGYNNKASNNLMLGSKAGYTNQSGQSNTFVGFQADADANNLENATAIGANAKVAQSNSIVLGNGANVGIGTSAPQAKLDINATVAGQSGLRLTQLTSAAAPTLTTNKYLTVDASGNVVLGSAPLTRGRQAADEEVWQKTGRYAQTTDTDGILIGSVDKTPDGYKLYVQDGILTEKVKVAIRNTAEWSDYVFAPSYHLKPLTEVEQYVKTNKHLPGVPSAEEVVRYGVNVGQMDAKLLEKIEELTLYIITQQKSIDTLRKAVSDLRNASKH